MMRFLTRTSAAPLALGLMAVTIGLASAGPGTDGARAITPTRAATPAAAGSLDALAGPPSSRFT